MYKKILKQYWGFDDFRGIQQEIINSIGSGKDTLGLMPTGGGKSITFQVPALAMEGVCIVVTPLIALMKDQVSNLRMRGIMATAIYSGMSRNEIISALENCILGDYKLLYVSPERLSTPIFQQKLRHMKVSFITVDEAHCISQWGYDFRPAYLSIADIRKLLPSAPVLALTATATPEVIEDIQECLGFREKNVFRMSYERSNLTYVVRKTSDKEKELIHILNSVKGSAVVYTRSRRGSQDIAKLLQQNGFSATYYHAGLEHATKDERQSLWKRDEIRIMVATNAFGMGIDKADVRLVIHMDCPDSIEAYFQEAGRAGRDGRQSWAVLLYNGHDATKLKRRIPDTYPEKEYICNVYEKLAYFYQMAMGFGGGTTHTFDIGEFCRSFKLFPTLVDSSLKILHNAGYIEYETDPDTVARMRFLLERNELYLLDNLSPNEENIITVLLRTYSGLFVDYTYIDESLIAQKSGLQQNQVYLILRNLSRRNIIHFIPQRKMPYITYRKDRVEMEYIVLSEHVYENRKEQMSKRIDAMIRYAENEETCRSRQLLSYFGEENSNDCKRCDVCNNKRGEDKSATIDAEDAILELLEDGQLHNLSEMNKIVLPKTILENGLRKLLEKEKVEVVNSKIQKK